MPPKLQQVQNVIAHEGIVNTVCLGHKTSQVFASGGDDRFLYLWAVGNNNPRSTFGPFQSPITASLFDSSEEKVACGNNGGTLMLLDINEQRCISNWAAHRSAVNSIVFHPQNAKMVLSCGYDGKIKIFSKTQRSAIQAYNAHNGSANSISCTSDGKFVATGGDDKTVRIFDIVAQRQIAKFDVHRDAVTCVAFHPVEPVLISCSKDRSIRFFDLEAMKEIPVSFPLDSSPVDIVTYVPNENVALSASPDYLKVVGWAPPEYFDHFTLGLDVVHDISIVDRVATIASSSGDRCMIHRLRLDQLKPFTSRPVRSRPSTPRLLDIEAIKNTPVEQPVQAASKKSGRLLRNNPSDLNLNNINNQANKQSSISEQNSMNNVYRNQEEKRVFLDFRRDRASFMSSMNEKYSRFTRIKDLIQQKGLAKTLQDVAQSGDLGIELLMIMRMKPEAVKLEHAAFMMQIAARVFDRDFDIAITTVESMLQAFGKLVNATRQIKSSGVGNDPVLDERKKSSELFIESFREIAPKLRTVTVGKSMTSQAASEILDEWKIFLR